MKITSNEAVVLKAVRDLCIDADCAAAKDVSTETHLAVNSVKGVLGSLVKKQLIVAIDFEDQSGSEFDAVVYLDKNEEEVSFGCDEDPESFHSDEEIDAMVQSQPDSKQSKSTKKDQAREIFDEMEGAKRKEVIERFIEEVGLTKAGASTYYQQFKKNS